MGPAGFEEHQFSLPEFGSLISIVFMAVKITLIEASREYVVVNIPSRAGSSAVAVVPDETATCFTPRLRLRGVLIKLSSSNLKRRLVWY